MKTIKDAFDLDYDDSVIALASGFPVGMGRSGCTCGAVAGGVMALGLVFGRTQAKDTHSNGRLHEGHRVKREKLSTTKDSLSQLENALP